MNIMYGRGFPAEQPVTDAPEGDEIAEVLDELENEIEAEGDNADSDEGDELDD